MIWLTFVLPNMFWRISQNCIFCTFKGKVTCSFVSHCQSGSDHTVRKPEVHPNPSVQSEAHIAFGSSADRCTRFPTSAQPTNSQNPAIKQYKHAQHEIITVRTDSELCLFPLYSQLEYCNKFH